MAGSLVKTIAFGKLWGAALLPALLLGACTTAGVGAGQPAAQAARAYYPAIDVAATGETQPVGTANTDAADDPAIWRNPADPAASLIVATDKKAGLYVYGLDGKVRSFLRAGRVNNVDLRDVTLPGGARRVLVAASDRSDKAVPKIALFWLDTATARLTELGALPFLLGDHAPMEAYGFCLGDRLGDGETGEIARAYVVMKDGTVTESLIAAGPSAPGGAARLSADYIREVKLATQAEGCVVDDASHTLFVAEEDHAIWRIPLDTVLKAHPFARVGKADGLVDDIEGLAVAREPGASGRAWLLASSQGDNAYAVFDLASGGYRGRFRINGGAIDGTSDTDGIEVRLGDFGPQFPGGLFIAQDGDNSPEAQNFKLVPWAAIRDALGLK
ncbi:phytase [Novosphingobium sp. 1949]|uniref:Phytase n=1 Tax=Novosphingobium organovorum TaxID=2930092 RepID=A0ABT0BCT6_9SPHN|nr:phytase [Novosphingobium organovorum]MCJ2182870.1 phytase [Novosphingobium organovorum]